MILSVLLNSSKRLSLVAEILYIVGLDCYLHPNVMLVLRAICLLSVVLELSNRELSSF